MKFLLTLSLMATFMGSSYGEDLLSNEIPYPFYDVQKQSEGKSNQMMVLSSGLGALQKRIELIRKAKDHIEVEYFIYALDESSKIITSELVKKAREGVTVKILIDKSGAVFEFNEFYAKALMKEGIEVRYYNAAATYRLSSINFRNHRKLISVDDKFAITGGRNIEDDYFDLSPEFNFLDHDVYIEGDLVKPMRETFDLFYEDDIAERPDLPKKPKATIKKRYKERNSAVWKYKRVPNTKKINAYNKKMNKAFAFMDLNKEESKLLKKIETIGSEILKDSKLRNCPEATFSTDRPGGNFIVRLLEDYGDDYRYLRKTLYDKLAAPDKKIIISSAYMINSPKTLDLYNLLISKDIELDLYTNSMASTDALYVAANLYATVFGWARDGITTIIHSGEYIPETPVVYESVKKAKWGTHSKVQMYEYNDSTKNEIMIGTYNVDNRSNHYNTEMAVFCKGSPELFSDLGKTINSRIDNGYTIHKNHSATKKDGTEVSIFGANKDDIEKMVLIAFPSWLANLLL